MGQAHSRCYRRIPMLFPDRAGEPELVVCSDTVARPAATRPSLASASREATADWRARLRRTPTSTSVVVTAPNMLHVEIVEAAARRRQAGLLREAGRRHAGADRRGRAAAARAAGVITGVGYNYRLAPLVQYAAQLIGDGRARPDHQLPRPLLLDVRQRPARRAELAVPAVDEGGYGVTTDLLSHAVDLAHLPRRRRSPRSSAPRATFITERPLPPPGGTPLRPRRAR